MRRTGSQFDRREGAIVLVVGTHFKARSAAKLPGRFPATTRGKLTCGCHTAGERVHVTLYYPCSLICSFHGEHLP
jgi:hypothetical protein